MIEYDAQNFAENQILKQTTRVLNESEMEKVVNAFGIAFQIV